MGKIFVYELRRMAANRLFLGLLIVNGVFDWYVLSFAIIVGIADTAPFSVWSYSAYLGKTMPAVIITVLLLLSAYYGKKQQRVEILISAAPMTPAQHFLIRTAVLFVCFGILCGVTVGSAGVFYIRFFAYDHFAAFFVPSLLIVVPCFVFAVGLGHLLGRVHPGMVYVEMVILIAGSWAATNVFDFFGARYFSSYPLALTPGPDGEPEFVMSAAWVLVRFLYLAAGAGLFLCNMYRAGRKAAQDG